MSTDPRDVAFPEPGRIGQGTAIEQSRAVAEVYAAVMVARQAPRNTQQALRDMREVTGMPALAEKAFFEFPRGGQTVAGASVYLARELARCWGNIQHGVAELRRDDEHGQSEMLAFAWDLQSNARVQTIFIVPHLRDKRGGPTKLTDMRDIYENNANSGARRVRECIFAVLPVWFREEAETICRRTLNDGGGKPLAQRVADALAKFVDLDVTEADLVRRVGRPVVEWTSATLGGLTTTYQSLKRGELSREEAFPPVLTGEAIVAGSATAHPAEQAGPGETVDQVASELAGWHAAGHPHDGPPPFERHVWDPDCGSCPKREQAGDMAEHYYGHTVDWIDGCKHCDRERAWKDEDDPGGGERP